MGMDVCCMYYNSQTNDDEDDNKKSVSHDTNRQKRTHFYFSIKIGNQISETNFRRWMNNNFGEYTRTQKKKHT